MGSGVDMSEYRWRNFDKFDATICVLILGFVLVNVYFLGEPLLVTTAQGLMLILVFLGGSRIVIIESKETEKEELKNDG